MFELHGCAKTLCHVVLEELELGEAAMFRSVRISVLRASGLNRRNSQLHHSGQSGAQGDCTLPQAVELGHLLL
jgi:hypothetical protein